MLVAWKENAVVLEAIATVAGANAYSPAARRAMRGGAETAPRVAGRDALVETIVTLLKLFFYRFFSGNKILGKLLQSKIY